MSIIPAYSVSGCIKTNSWHACLTFKRKRTCLRERKNRSTSAAKKATGKPSISVDRHSYRLAQDQHQWYQVHPHIFFQSSQVRNCLRALLRVQSTTGTRGTRTHLRQLEKFTAHQSRLILEDLASNRIGSRGAYFLTRGAWKLLESLGLSIYVDYSVANQIMDEGLIHLQKGQWNNLTILILCIS